MGWPLDQMVPRRDKMVHDPSELDPSAFYILSFIGIITISVIGYILGTPIIKWISLGMCIFWITVWCYSYYEYKNAVKS